MRLTTALLATALSSITVTPTTAQQPAEFMTPQQAIKGVMDGRPWLATTAEGRDMQATFNADGSASIKGPFPVPMSGSWVVKGQDICLTVSMAGTKCLRFRTVAGGFDGWVGGKPDLTLRR
jgi:hypothetical protein